MSKLSSVINKKTVGAAFFVLILLLIFFSKTIYTHNLPQVTGAKPSRGPLNKLEISSGIAEWAVVEKGYAPIGGTVGEVLAGEGDLVEEGQKLFRLEFNQEDAERKLQELASNRQKLVMDLDNIKTKITQVEKNKAGGYDLTSLDADIDKAQKSLENGQALLAIDGISQQELENLENSLESLQLKREKMLADYDTDKANLERDLQAKQMDIDNISFQEEPYRKQLAEYAANAVITAPFGGTLISLNVEKGAKINQDALIFTIGVGQEFVVECNISLDNNFVAVGDTCSLSNSTHTPRGTVSKLESTSQNKVVSIALNSADLSAGETFEVRFEKRSNTSYALVPNGAVNQDNEGYYLYVIRKRKGLMGDEYFIDRQGVYIGDSDSQNTAIEGWFIAEPVMVTSNKAVSAGESIILENASDFFER